MQAPARGLEIEEDLEVEHKLHIFRIAAWSLFTLILLAGFLGLLGPGPLSKKRVGDASAWIEHNRFDHYQSSSEVVIGYGLGAIDGETVAIELPRSYLDRVLIEEVIPSPARTISAPDSVIYQFTLAPGVRKQGKVLFSVKARAAGVAKGPVFVGSAKPLELWQLYFP